MTPCETAPILLTDAVRLTGDPLRSYTVWIEKDREPLSTYWNIAVA